MYINTVGTGTRYVNYLKERRYAYPFYIVREPGNEGLPIIKTKFNFFKFMNR